MLTEKWMDLSMFPGLDIKTIRMRALTGEDLVASAGRCSSSGDDAAVFSIMLRQQQVAQAITEVNGEKIMGPCLASLKWNARTRYFVNKLYNHLNETSAEEDELFKTALLGESAPAETAPASPDGV